MEPRSRRHGVDGHYRALGLERPDEPSWAMWRRWQQEEGHSGKQ
jgi:hypothetical protein